MASYPEIERAKADFPYFARNLANIYTSAAYDPPFHNWKCREKQLGPEDLKVKCKRPKNGGQHPYMTEPYGMFATAEGSYVVISRWVAPGPADFVKNWPAKEGEPDFKRELTYDCLNKIFIQKPAARCSSSLSAAVQSFSVTTL